MRKVEISKRNGKVRLIYVPDKEEKRVLHNAMYFDKFFVRKFDSCVTGFVAGRGIYNNAIVHIGYNYTLSFDLETFFDTVKPEMVKAMPDYLERICFVDNAARQGLPTSPFLSNIAAEPLDKAIKRALKKKISENVVYTRYADDLSISFNDKQNIPIIKEIVKECISRCHFKMNESKTKLLDSKSGRRIICGVSVGNTDIRPTRKTKRKLRAAKHRKNESSATGLIEFMKLKKPKIRTIADLDSFKCLNEAKQIIHDAGHKESAKKLRIVEKAISEYVGKFVITNDSVYFACISSLGNSWSSCMSIKNQRGGGTTFYHNLEGVSVAFLPSGKHKTLYGVTRMSMRARALIFKCIDNNIYYDRIYPNNSAATELENLMKAKGFLKASNYSGKRIIGKVLRNSKLPYVNSIKIVKMRINGKEYHKAVLR